MTKIPAAAFAAAQRELSAAFTDQALSDQQLIERVLGAVAPYMTWTANTRLDRLDDMLANLQQHIDQRASELAAPLIDEADERVAAAEERCRELRDASWSARREHDRRTEVLRQRAEASEDAIVKTHDHLTRNLTGLVGKSGYEAGYRDCANEITRILNATTDQLEAPGA